MRKKTHIFTLLTVLIIAGSFISPARAGRAASARPASGPPYLVFLPVIENILPIDFLPEAARIDGGEQHTCALNDGNELMCWGYNGLGQLGIGSTSNQVFPTGVHGLEKNIRVVTAGDQHTCVLTDAGVVKCWGSNQYGQIGVGPDIFYSTLPMEVGGLPGGIISVAAGGEHTCALTADGKVKCWGKNDWSQLGNGTYDQQIQYTPVDVVGLTAEVVRLAAGHHHTCALTRGGEVKCWGGNGDGQSGQPFGHSQYPTPQNVAGLPVSVVAITAGRFHTCALNMAGGMHCWGDNSEGQLGDDVGDRHYTPGNVFGLSSGVLSIAAGDQHTCAVTAGGGVKCWGRNDVGAVGDGSQQARRLPVDVYGLASGMEVVTAGGMHSCAMSGVWIIKCWGANSAGALGNGDRGYSLIPVDVVW